MPCCLLRATGASFKPDAFLEESVWEADRIDRLGERTSPRAAPHEEGGFTVLVCEEGEFAKQVEDAILFLRDNGDEVSRLLRSPGLECVQLDFGLVQPADTYGSFFKLPLALLRRAADLGVELELSVYRGG